MDIGRRIGSSMRMSTVPTCDRGIRWPAVSSQGEIGDLARIEPRVAGRTGRGASSA